MRGAHLRLGWRLGLAAAKDMTRLEGIPQNTGVEFCSMDWPRSKLSYVRLVLSLIKLLTKVRQISFLVVSLVSGIIGSYPT